MNAAGWSEFSTPGKVQSRLALTCLGAGEQSGYTYHLTRRSLEHHALVLISAGSGTFKSYDGRVDRKVKSPAFLWLLPNVDHSYRSASPGWTEHWMFFAGISARLFEEAGLVDPSRAVNQLTALPARAVDSFSVLRQILKQRSTLSDAAAGNIAESIILEILSLSSGFEPRRRIAEQYLTLSDSHPTVEAIARQLGFSARTLRRSIQAETGLTAAAYLTRDRINRAQALLADTSLSVAEISRAVGLQDPAYFSRLFRAKVGLSPSLFRERQTDRFSGLAERISDRPVAIGPE